MELIKLKNSRYAEYENLLFRRDALRKEGEQFQLEYIKTFGDLMNDVFKKKIECIEKKKKIAFCQAKANKGLDILETELSSYIESTMTEYYEKLEEMISDTQMAKSGVQISVLELRKIKEIYRSLAKLIHPDKRPDLADDEYIKKLWRQIVIAYTYNNLSDLEELKFKTERYLEESGNDSFDIEIPDIEGKIRKVTEEIDSILNTIPYQYRFILESEAETESRIRELEDEWKSYEAYSEQLDEILNRFKIVRIIS